MQIIHTPFHFAHHTLHRVVFAPESFHTHDLLWLPHHAKLASAGRKRHAEHLAGRVAAVHALREYGYQHVPDIGEQRQPLWPEGLYGSISHCATTALAVVSRQPVGVDIEAVFTPALAAELASSIVTGEERAHLERGEWSFDQALTLAFSAKESAFKAAPTSRQTAAGFEQYHMVDVQHDQLILRAHDQTYRVQWQFSDGHVVTLATR